MDKFTPSQRHHCMASIRSKDTKPELIVRHYLFAHGYRYRLNHPRLPGHPDIVMRKYRTVIFVNGCFWHGHEGCKNHVLPKTRTDYWHTKIERNRERDKEVQHKLARMGWHCITVWECQLKPKVKEETLQSLDYTLTHIFIEDHKARRYTLPEQEFAIAAELTPEYKNKNNNVTNETTASPKTSD
jgi:DNA mismatch endonuclease, patch repair protein